MATDKINEAARELLNELRHLARHEKDSACLQAIDAAMRDLVAELEADNKWLRKTLEIIASGAYRTQYQCEEASRVALADQQPEPKGST